MSKRKSPSLVAFSNGDMLVGEAAAGIVARYPEKVYSQLHHIVGKPFLGAKKLLETSYLPFDIVEDNRGSASFRIDDGESIFSSEELLALLLSYAKSLAESHAKTTIKDAVIAVPPYLGQTERECLIVAAELGGLNVLTLINQHSGVALQYGISKDFADEPKHVLFYDMGASGAYAALVYYSAYTTKEFGKNKTVNQFQVSFTFPHF
jgi:hypoxia up-regulated 1